METFVKVLLVGGAAYLGYELFLAPAAAAAPASWTAVGGTTAQWSGLSATAQSQWNALAASSQTGEVALSLLTYGTLTPPVSAATTPVTATAVPVQATAPAQPATTTASTTQTLANLAQAIQNAAGNDPNLVNGMMTGDHWNYYANILTGKTILNTWTNEDPMTFAQYWTLASPVIAAQTGLGSIMAGLGAVVQAQRRRAGMGEYRYSPNTPPAMLQPNIENNWN